MPEVPVPLDPAALKTLTIATSQVLPNALTQIMLGDILQFSVRSNPPDDLGVLFFRGNLIKANIPPEFEAGDRLTARVTQQGEQVLLKVVDVEKAANIAQQPSRVLENPAQSSLVAQLADIFRTAGVPLYTEPQILPAPINLEQAGQLSNEIKN
ncbi:MAG TPA: hypothetical protein PLP17_04190, partial [Oligoflexia bacterium]|nr:hypothetical protein [Oligoflexia bacterium]